MTFEIGGSRFYQQNSGIISTGLYLELAELECILGENTFFFPMVEQCEEPGFWSYFSDNNFGENCLNDLIYQNILMM